MVLRPSLSRPHARQPRALTNYPAKAQLLCAREEIFENGATAPVRRYNYLGYPQATGLIRRRGLDRAKKGHASRAPGSEHPTNCERRGGLRAHGTLR